MRTTLEEERKRRELKFYVTRIFDGPTLRARV
jgi:hypothetical protein